MVFHDLFFFSSELVFLSPQLKAMCILCNGYTINNETFMLKYRTQCYSTMKKTLSACIQITLILYVTV